MNTKCLKDEIRNGAWWLYVGGNQGAGKTTISCALAIQVAQKRRGVLLVSRKSTHNISDVFGQEFTNKPTRVRGVDHLYAVELDALPPRRKLKRRARNEKRISHRLAKRLFDTFHCYDLYINYKQIDEFMKQASARFVVWDTAASIDNFGLFPFEQPSQCMLRKDASQTKFVPKFEGTSFDHFNQDVCSKEIYRMLNTMTKKCPWLKYPCENTFVLVDTIHPLHVLGNKLLINCLAQNGINTHLIVNRLTSQAVPPYDIDKNNVLCHKIYTQKCGSCCIRVPITKLPLMDSKIRNVVQITSFSAYLYEPYFKDSSEEEEEDENAGETGEEDENEDDEY